MKQYQQQLYETVSPAAVRNSINDREGVARGLHMLACSSDWQGKKRVEARTNTTDAKLTLQALEVDEPLICFQCMYYKRQILWVRGLGMKL